jgi:hypothetical protein
MNQRIDALITDHDSIRDMNIGRNNALLNAGSITADEHQTATFNFESNHRINNNRINTSDRYKLEAAEFLKMNQEFEKQFHKWNEDTSKVIKVFNESLGLSSTALIHSELSI